MTRADVIVGTRNVDTPLSDHLEIETYTWDVLPAHLKTGDITEYVSRELEWMRATLLAAGMRSRSSAAA